MRLVWAVALAALAFSAGAGCKKSKQAEKESAAAEQPVPRAANRPTPAKARALLARRQPRRIAPIAIADVTAMLPPPEGATVLTAPSKPDKGERVQAVYCFENTTPADAGAKLQAALEASGWSSVHVRTRPDAPERAAVAAQQPPFRASASIRRVPAPRCNADAGHSFATVTVHKIQDARPAPDGEGRP